MLGQFHVGTEFDTLAFAQSAVQRERASFEGKMVFKREVDLVRVATKDGFLDGCYLSSIRLQGFRRRQVMNRDPILAFSAWRMLNAQDRAALELMGKL